MLAKHNEGYNMLTSCSSQEKIPICRPIFFQACYNKHTHFLFGLIKKQNKNKKLNKIRKSKKKKKLKRHCNYFLRFRAVGPIQNTYGIAR